MILLVTYPNYVCPWRRVANMIIHSVERPHTQSPSRKHTSTYTFDGQSLGEPGCMRRYGDDLDKILTIRNSIM